MKVFQLVALAVVVVLVMATPAFAQQAPTTSVLSGGAIGAGLGVALAIVGAGYGFGRIGAAALESMARHPQVAGNVQTAAIIIGALLEGATFFGLLVCILINGQKTF